MLISSRANTALLVLILAVGLGIVAILASGVRGGPLDPPGAPGSTMKTLDQVEARTPISSLPYVISQAGSYYLTGNLSVNSAIDGITVQADDVTLDLNGFELKGNGVGSGAISEGAESPARHNWRIFNGAIVGWGYAVHAPSVSNGQIDHLSASAIRTNGFFMGGAGRLANCSAEGNPADGTGIVTGLGSIVDSCTIRNFSTGLFVAEHSVLTGCTVTGALVGVSAKGATVASCRISATGTGINVFSTGGAVLENQIDMGSLPSTCGVLSTGTAPLIDGNRIAKSQNGVCLLANTSAIATRNSFVNLTVVAFSGYTGNDVPSVVPAASATNPLANICTTGACGSTP